MQNMTGFSRVTWLQDSVDLYQLIYAFLLMRMND